QKPDGLPLSGIVAVDHGVHEARVDGLAWQQRARRKQVVLARLSLERPLQTGTGLVEGLDDRADDLLLAALEVAAEAGLVAEDSADSQAVVGVPTKRIFGEQQQRRPPKHDAAVALLDQVPVAQQRDVVE